MAILYCNFYKILYIFITPYETCSAVQRHKIAAK